ncbi:MAG: hypothetical protein ABIU29_11105, partial [Chthoniobacterales bacterium]
AFVTPAVIITWFAFATGDGVATLVVTTLVTPTVIITTLALAAGDGVATLVVAAFVTPAVIITWFAFAAGDGVATLVVAASMTAAVIIPTFALTAHEGGLATFVITPLVTSAAAVIAAAVGSYVLIAVPANHLISALSSRGSAVRDTLVDGPVVHAPAATAHAHAGRTPAVRLAVAAGEKSKPGRDDSHSRSHN